MIFDYNLDGNEDIFVTNGYRKYGSDNDSRIRINETRKEYNNKVPIEMKKRLYDELPSEKLPNLLYKNEGDLTFKEVGNNSALNDPSFSNGAAYADLDNDGDLEIIVNNIDEDAFVYKNLSIENKLGNYLKVELKGNLSENFAKGTIYFGKSSKIKESKRVRGYLSSVSDELHFGLGKVSKIDSLVVEWSSGTKQVVYEIEANRTISVNEDNSILANSINNLYLEKLSSLDRKDIIKKSMERGFISIINEEEEMAEEDGEMKVKVMKIGHGGDVHEMMNEILGG